MSSSPLSQMENVLDKIWTFQSLKVNFGEAVKSRKQLVTFHLNIFDLCL